MAKSRSNPAEKRSVGIKELKDQASGLVDAVERGGQTIVITRNNRRVARLVPIQDAEVMGRMRDLGLIASEPKLDWSELRLNRIGADARVAIDAILSDRGGDE